MTDNIFTQPDAQTDSGQQTKYTPQQLDQELKLLKKLRSQIKKHKHLYYVAGTPEISDAEYDALEKQYAEILAKHPDWRIRDEPLDRIGEKSELATIRHEVPMQSLKNVETNEALQRFADDIQHKLAALGNDAAVGFSVEPKIDGLSIAIRYENGQLQLAATRGDGVMGEDVTASARLIASIPHQLVDVPEFFEVRGEVCLRLSTFHKIVTSAREQLELVTKEIVQAEAGNYPRQVIQLLQRKKRNLQRLSELQNPRNATVGILRQLDPEFELAQGNPTPAVLDAFLYQVVNGQDYGLTSQSHIFDWLEKLGFAIPPRPGQANNVSQLLALADQEHFKQFVTQADFAVDGLAIKVDSLEQQQLLNQASQSDQVQKYPQWAVARKFPAKQATTRLEEITLQVGKTGMITPVAELKPVWLDGTVVSRASLHNSSIITSLDLHLGDQVIIAKAGEIIPQVVGVDIAARTGKETVFVMPDNCPVCHSQLTRLITVDSDREIVRHICENPDCLGRLRAWLRHFVSTSGLDIEGLGPELLDDLLDAGLIKSVADLFTLDQKQLAKVIYPDRDDTDKAATGRKVTLLMESLEKARQSNLAKILSSLAIPDVGVSTARVLAQHFGSIDNIKTASENDIASIPIGTGVSSRRLGSTIAEKLHKTLQNPPIQRQLAACADSELAQTIIALGLPDIQEQRAQALASHFGSGQALLSADVSQLSSTPMGVSTIKRTLGPVVASSLKKWLTDPVNTKLLSDLEAAGLSLHTGKVKTESANLIAEQNDIFATDTASNSQDSPAAGEIETEQNSAVFGKSFVVTGKLENYSRKEIQDKISAAGGIVHDSISSGINYLVVGEKAGSKLAKAEKLGIARLSLDELLALLDNK